ncbi:MAG: glycosyltransferase family 2 protein [Candidatus Omnitrophica bacterium]|nr:glycosyltransferase family 2 protein [Candidatus Omnitrophota bacterium]
MKTCVIIPAYNEAKTISGIVSLIRSQAIEVVIIDDGSLDNTSGLAQENGAFVIKNTQNQGKGASLNKGFNYALDKGFDAVITMDGDGQHLPEEIPDLIGAAEAKKADIVLGNRMQNTKGMPFVRILTNKFMSWLISVIAKQDIPDTQCGFRLIKKEVLKSVFIKSSKYEAESEILIKASRAGFKIASVPVKTVYLGEASKINPVTDTFRFLKYIIRELWSTRN